jgi:hypothetical protein
LGFSCKEAPSILKALLHAQAYMQCSFEDGSEGSLISLKQFRSSTTHREEGMQVILSAQLMPHYTFQTGRRGRLLVPFPQFPRFESAPQYHAGQALLQMLIIEEFMEQSLEFASEGSIRIAAERLDVFFQQSNLPRSVCDLVRAQWQRECSDGFLLQVSQDRFTLQTSYAKEMNFLRAQGQLRKERQRQGKNSVKKRRVVRLPTFN